MRKLQCKNFEKWPWRFYKFHLLLLATSRADTYHSRHYKISYPMVCRTMVCLSQSLELERFEYYVSSRLAWFLKLPITFQLLNWSSSNFIWNSVNISYNEISCQISKITTHVLNTGKKYFCKVIDSFLQFSPTIFCWIETGVIPMNAEFFSLSIGM